MADWLFEKKITLY